ncbi:MAG: hypothetical protein H6P98_1090 [Candidatus Aminicenantes bacterium]|nr:hypothetical protein [Candidatus Aminicenantes bacterium]
MKIRGALIILLLAMVIVYFLYFAKAGKKSYIEGAMDANDRMRGELTQVNMTTMQGAIDLFIGTEGEAPADLKTLFAARLFSGDPSDGWGTPLKYERLSDSTYRLTGAGKDRAFDTDDDIVIER